MLIVFKVIIMPIKLVVGEIWIPARVHFVVGRVSNTSDVLSLSPCRCLQSHLSSAISIGIFSLVVQKEKWGLERDIGMVTGTHPPTLKLAWIPLSSFLFIFCSFGNDGVSQSPIPIIFSYPFIRWCMGRMDVRHVEWLFESYYVLVR